MTGKTLSGGFLAPQEAPLPIPMGWLVGTVGPLNMAKSSIDSFVEQVLEVVLGRSMKNTAIIAH